MKKYNTEAFVLKSSSLKDSDKLYVLFTKPYGKVFAVAKGVRKVTSRRSGNLDSLNNVFVGLHENAAGYKYITEVKSLASYKNIKKSLALCFHGYYVAELVYRYVEEDSQSESLYYLLGKTLDLLDSQSVPPELAVGYFETNFLNLLGYSLSFGKCVMCGKPLDKNWGQYKFSYDKGGLVCNCSSEGQVLSIVTAIVLYKMQQGVFNFNLDRIDYRGVDAISKQLLNKTLGGKIKTLDIAV